MALKATLFQQIVNVFYVVERVVDVESKFGDYAQLVAYAVAKLETDALCAFVKHLHHLCAFRRGTYA
jgi:hypothetical protein